MQSLRLGCLCHGGRSSPPGPWAVHLVHTCAPVCGSHLASLSPLAPSAAPLCACSARHMSVPGWPRPTPSSSEACRCVGQGRMQECTHRAARQPASQPVFFQQPTAVSLALPHPCVWLLPAAQADDGRDADARVLTSMLIIQDIMNASHAGGGLSKRPPHVVACVQYPGK